VPLAQEVLAADDAFLIVWFVGGLRRGYGTAALLVPLFHAQGVMVGELRTDRFPRGVGLRAGYRFHSL